MAPLISTIVPWCPANTPPPFATLALVQTAGGAYTRDAIFSLAITLPPPDREMFSASVDAGFFFALPFHHGELEHDCVEVSTRGERRGGGEVSAKREASSSVEHEAERCYRYTSGRLASFSVEGRGSRALPRSSWSLLRAVRVRGRQI